MNSFLRGLNLCRSTVMKTKRFYSNDLYDPPYLELFKSKIPLYDTINIQLHGYDYSQLESYQKLLHSYAKSMNLQVDNGWATPAQHLQVVSYKPNTDIVQSQYRFKVYERNLQIVGITSVQFSTLLRILDSSIPSGVTIKVLPHEEYHEEVRYVPDLELATLKQQLDDMGGPSKK
ncbi:hypothetical protein RN001_003911 [Aquatica leii]|uniref:Small ribosomal subunit protein uS10 domain-containing protein n=1 Tax=Aquatica leii TaxID=1421715 RepID=A0AAN7ST42_9COLE|nr:hypothetical protein RN001_003911 [Aquatica leii]